MKKKVVLLSILLANIILLNGCGTQTQKINKLCEAIENENTDEALELAEKIKNYDTSRSEMPILSNILTQGAYDTESPLKAACAKGNVEVIEYLLEQGADPNYTVYGNSYPLESYCEKGYKNGGLELLLEYGAEPDYALTQITPLHDLSAFMYHIDSEEYKEEYATKLSMINCLIANGAELEWDGFSVMHSAAIQSTRDYFDLLWQYPECHQLINTKVDGGETPLMWLARCNSLDMFLLFVEHGAKADAVDDDGKTVLDYARENEDDEILRYLEG